jgi:hypothetical protein
MGQLLYLANQIYIYIYYVMHFVRSNALHHVHIYWPKAKLLLQININMIVLYLNNMV